MLERQRVGIFGYPLGRSRRIARTRVSTWPRSTLITLLAAIIVAGLCLIYLWQGTMILNLTAQRESAQATVTTVEEVNRWLEFKIGEAFSLERVSHLAREELRMSEPTAIRYVHVVPTPTEP